MGVRDETRASWADCNDSEVEKIGLDMVQDLRAYQQQRRLTTVVQHVLWRFIASLSSSSSAHGLCQMTRVILKYVIQKGRQARAQNHRRQTVSANATMMDNPLPFKSKQINQK